MLAQGFDVVGLDLAESAVADQASRLGADRAVRADVTTWMPDELFDAVYDQTCLCALPPELWVAYEAQLRRWLRPGGRLFVLFMQTGQEGGPPFDCAIPTMRTLFASWKWPSAQATAIERATIVLDQVRNAPDRFEDRAPPRLRRSCREFGTMTAWALSPDPRKCRAPGGDYPKYSRGDQPGRGRPGAVGSHILRQGASG
jgi:SAM-dependent methyltransferase